MLGAGKLVSEAKSILSGLGLDGSWPQEEQVMSLPCEAGYMTQPALFKTSCPGACLCEKTAGSVSCDHTVLEMADIYWP